MQSIFFIITTVIIICISGCSRQYNDSVKIIFEKSGIIYSIEQDGTGREQITNGSTASHSPKEEAIIHQKFIVFQQICITDTNTLTTFQVTNTGFNNWSPTWSPDGKKFYFTLLKPALTRYSL
jgi:Tol biopolymer transport system component